MSGVRLKAAIPPCRTTCRRHTRFYAEWNPARFIQWAGKTGESYRRLVEEILNTRPYPEQGYKHVGIINLTRNYDPARVKRQRAEHKV